jgi:hypothetical protein
MTSSPHGPYVLGYTRATMVSTTGSKDCEVKQILKRYLSSDCTLQLECMKLELLVIVDQRATVNAFPGLVHTARHTMGVGSTLRQGFKTLDHGIVSDWGEVVTR